MKESLDILVVGTGAVGSFYGGKLSKTNARVSALCRSDYEIVKREGIKIKSYKGDFAFNPFAVYRKADEVDTYPDFVMLCLKVLPSIDPREQIGSSVGPNTVIVLVQNGIEIEPAVAEAFPDNELISGIAFIAVRRLELGIISHQGSGSITLGNYPSGASQNTKRLAKLFSEAGVPCQVTEDIVASRWKKMIWNASFNPISVLGKGADSAQMLECPESEKLIRAVMEEVVSLAAAEGKQLADDLIDKIIAGTREMRPFKTSMLVDHEAGRTMEIEAILGNTIRIAERRSVPVPYLKSLYGLLKLAESLG